ncbi:lysozyme inhibitor LprI family protein [Ureibacillus manganicus]|uniref:Lysozyme inhibitor LprI-like N-terminal domain-containing protein n=1 Tax=Ureibacillus manganicus DSM 26584 TaxID=1384049 RepID=A0A0A3HT17_9BACL|nr:lysozyme inhibitor LprI family protein [Ureibacillus manganicus]KGR74335.1 hypothetical protein CD29_18620 [Ureibacillus manganicus DSM 26584]
MTTKWKLFIATGVLLLILTGCDNSLTEPNNTISQTEDPAPETKDSSEPTIVEDIKTDESIVSNGESSETSKPTEVAASLKDNYLKKLNEMEEADRNLEPASTIAGLEEQEAERYNKWDSVLNEVYSVLIEQLDKEQMDQLREDQRNWIIYRDETAKESSLKYSGGSYEALEYVATQATLTKERSYLLVAKYMK